MKYIEKDLELFKEVMEIIDRKYDLENIKNEDVLEMLYHLVDEYKYLKEEYEDLKEDKNDGWDESAWEEHEFLGSDK